MLHVGLMQANKVFTDRLEPQDKTVEVNLKKILSVLCTTSFMAFGGIL